MARWLNSRSRIARRTAGRLGDGGGPGIWVRIFPPPRPAVRGEAEMLQVGKGNAAHQHVSVQAGPGLPLEMSEAEFLLELLVRLLRNNCRLYLHLYNCAASVQATLPSAFALRLTGAGPNRFSPSLPGVKIRANAAPKDSNPAVQPTALAAG